MQLIQTYINNCNRRLETGDAREHSYRSNLQPYNKIINTLLKTDAIMKGIDEVLNVKQ